MLLIRFKKLLPGLILGLYAVALLGALSGLALLRSDRTGILQVDKVMLETTPDKRQQLVVRGRGFSRDLKAVVATLPAIVDHEFFLDRDVGRGLWTDGQTILVTYRKRRLLDIRLQDSGDFSVVGSLELPGNIDQFVKVGDRVLVSLGSDGFRLVDMQVQGQPYLLEQVWEIEGGCPPVRSMLASGRKVYVPFRDGRLAIFDLGKKKVPLTLVDVASHPWQATMHGNWLVTGDLHGKLQLFDLDPQGLPRPVGDRVFDKDIRSVAMNGTSLFVAVGNEELYRFDLQNWPHLGKGALSQVQGNILALRLVPDSPFLLVARAGLGFLSLNIAEPDNPQVISEFLQTFTPFDMQAVGRRVFSVGQLGLIAPSLDLVLDGTADGRLLLKDFDYHVHSWDGEIFLLPVSGAGTSGIKGSESRLSRLGSVTDFQNGRACRSCSDEFRHQRPAADKCRVFPQYRSKDLLQVYCRDETGGQPRRQANLHLVNPEAGLWRQGIIYTVNHSYEVSDQERTGHLHIYDADPETPVVIGQLSLPGGLRDLAWLDPHYLVVSAGQSGLHVVDVADPAAPRLVGHFDLPFHLREIAQTDQLLRIGKQMYVTHHRAGVSQVDLTDVRQPRLKQILNLPGFARRMVQQDDLLFISLHREGVYMIDTGTDQGLTPIGRLETPVSAQDVAACRCRLAVSGGPSGLFQMPLPRKIEVRTAGRTQTVVPLPTELEPGTYRLYLYNGRESLRIDSAFRIEPEADRALAQKD